MGRHSRGPIFLSEEERKKLKEGRDYVDCPKCKKRMILNKAPYQELREIMMEEGYPYFECLCGHWLRTPENPKKRKGGKPKGGAR